MSIFDNILFVDCPDLYISSDKVFSGEIFKKLLFSKCAHNKSKGSYAKDSLPDTLFNPLVLNSIHTHSLIVWCSHDSVKTKLFLDALKNREISHSAIVVFVAFESETSFSFTSDHLKFMSDHNIELLVHINTDIKDSAIINIAGRVILQSTGLCDLDLISSYCSTYLKFMDTLHPVFKNKSAIASSDSDSFKQVNLEIQTTVPLFPHVGSFGVPRKNHNHEGIDLYCPEGDAVYAVSSGTVVGIHPFTGLLANSPWWHDTSCIMVESMAGMGVFCYGEIDVNPSISVGDVIGKGDLIGHVKRVLINDKGRPMSMLHFERYIDGTVAPIAQWASSADKPLSLINPTSVISLAMRATSAEEDSLNAGRLNPSIWDNITG